MSGWSATLRVDHRRRVSLGAITEDRRRALQQLAAPLRDLVRVDVELLGQLRQRLVALDGRYRHPIVGKSIPRIDF